MSAPRLRRAKEVFEQALALPEHRRSHFIRSACHGDGELETEVHRLLRFDGVECDLLDGAPEDRRWEELVSDETAAGTTLSHPGRIGPYLILDRLGVGGMGIVYRAREESPSREVALKVLRSDCLAVSAIDRFEHEVAVLARLEHPGIARIYRAGATRSAEGRSPYFAMELIDGRTLLDHARLEGLSVTKKLELFLGALDAIHYAHEQGIVHRDLKPENILVDARGRTKILDFGISKTLDANGARFTMTGQVVGTLSYISPEQLLDGEVDRRSDVFSLGVLLFELLAGRSPFELTGSSLRQAMHCLQNRDPLLLGQVAPELRGDLEAITRTALERSPAQRYATASDLADDIRRYLRDEPVRARPATAFYHFCKFARRHRAMVSGLLVAAVALVAGTAVSVVFAIQAGRDSRSAEQRRLEATESRAAMRQSLYQAQMLEASFAARSSQGLGRVREIVDAWRPVAGDEDLRGWEWQLLKRWSRSREKVLRPMNGVHDVAMHPGGRLLAAAGSEGLKIGDLETGSWRKVEVGAGRLYAVSWSPDGRRLLAAGDPGMMLLDIERPEVPIWKRPLQQKVGELWFGPCEGQFQSRGFGGPPTLRALESGEVLQELPKADRKDGSDPCLSPDGRFLAVRRGSDRVEVVDLESSNVVWQFPAESWPIGFFEWSPNGDLLAEGYRDGTVAVWNVRTGKLVLSTPAHGNWVDDLAWSPDGRLLASAGWDQVVRVFDLERNLDLALLQGHTARVTTLDWSPDGRFLVSAAASDAIRIWDASQWSGQKTRFSRMIREADIEWHPSGQELFTLAIGAKRFPIGETGLGSPLPFPAIKGNWSAAGDRALVRSSGRELRVGRVDATSEFTLEGPPIDFRPDVVRWHPTIDGLVAAMVDHTLVALDVGTMTEWAQLPTDGQLLYDIAWVPGSRQLVVAGGQALLRVDIDTRVVEQITPDRHTHLAFEPGGERFAAASSSGSVRIFDAESWAEVGVLRETSREITALDWHPQGDRLMTTDRQKTLRLWSVATGGLLSSFDLRDRALDAAWDPTGRYLAIALYDGTLELWDGGESR